MGLLDPKNLFGPNVPQKKIVEERKMTVQVPTD